jgi:hypothetical protein
MKNKKLNLSVFIQTTKSIINRFFSGEIIQEKNRNFIFVLNGNTIFSISIDIPQKLPTQTGYSEEKLEEEILSFFAHNIRITSETSKAFIIKYEHESYCSILLTIKKIPEEFSIFWNTAEEMVKRKFHQYSEKILKEIQLSENAGMTLTQITLKNKSASPIQKKNILAQLEYENKIKVKIDKRRGKPRRTYFAI